VSQDFSSIMHALAAEYPQSNKGRDIQVVPLREEFVGSVRPVLLLLYGAVIVVLLISCVNVANLLLIRGADREREIAVRVALGASRSRVLGMILFDVVKLTAPGVAVGLLLAAAIVRLQGENFGIPLSSVENLAYFVGGAIAILVAVLSGLAPARRAASVLPMVAMRSE
jgi:ABC-type antimicrobial peptide transport system permease subunit